MITTVKHKNITWVNLTSPSVKEIEGVIQDFSIHPLVAEELTSLTMRPKVVVYPNNLYLILHFPSVNSTFSANGGCEVDFVIGHDYLITTHYCDSPALEKFLRNAKTNEFKEKYFQNHAGFLTYYILKELYAFSQNQLDQIYVKINKLEKQLFEGHEKQTIKDLSLLSRDILDFKRNIYPHDTALASFEQSGKEFFGKGFEHYLNLLQGEYVKIRNLIENSKETIETLHTTNESLLSTKTNEIMKTLTIMAFITFPLMLLSSVFGMNTTNTPIVGLKGDFWIIVIVMAIGTFTMFLFFKHKKWL